MRFPRIYDEQPFELEQSFQLGEFGAKHLIQVLRAKVGDGLLVFNGKGGEYQAEITAIRKQQVTIQLLAFEPPQPSSSCQLFLAQAISRGEKMDYTLQKATELGVKGIIPLITERTFSHQVATFTKKYFHWRRIVISAAEQCGRDTLPDLHRPLSLEAWLPTISMPARWVLSPTAKASFHSLFPIHGEAVIINGPEGGLTSAEIALAEQYQFMALKMGPRILRTETAAVTALSLLQYINGDF